MFNTLSRKRVYHHCRWIAALVVLFVNLILPVVQVQAQDDVSVQSFDGHIAPGFEVYYKLPDLKEGDVIYAYLEATTGNLDPFLAIMEADLDFEAMLSVFVSELNDILRDEAVTLAAIQSLRNKYFLAWDDNSGEGYDAALEFRVPADSDYRLEVVGKHELALRIDRYMIWIYPLGYVIAIGIVVWRIF